MILNISLTTEHQSVMLNRIRRKFQAGEQLDKSSAHKAGDINRQIKVREL